VEEKERGILIPNQAAEQVALSTLTYGETLRSIGADRASALDISEVWGYDGYQQTCKMRHPRKDWSAGWSMFAFHAFHCQYALSTLVQPHHSYARYVCFASRLHQIYTHNTVLGTNSKTSQQPLFQNAIRTASGKFSYLCFASSKRK